MDKINETNKFIEKTIENKFNEVLNNLPITDLSKKKDNIYLNISLYDTYKNTLNTIIDIINDIINLINESYYIKDKYIIYEKFFNIFFIKERIFYIGIIIVILSLIIYFIDN